MHLWNQTFKNVFIGISPAALMGKNKVHPELPQVVAGIDPARLLLESDAPYLLPNSLRPRYGKVATPTLIYYVAEQVATWRKVPLAKALQDACTAAQLFYGL